MKLTYAAEKTISPDRGGSPAGDRWTPRNILVIGGAGYIGSALTPMLLECGHRVRVVDLLLFGREPLAPYLDHPNLELIKADFRHIPVMVSAMRGMDAIVHLGGIVGDPACSLDEQLTLDINLMATHMIVEIAKQSRVKRFIFASTCSVYGQGREMLDENSALKPLSIYARSKLASEKVLRDAADQGRLHPTILRFGTIYGLSGRARFDLVVNLLTAMALVDGKITIFNGDQWRPFLHVRDAALAIFKCLAAPLDQVGEQTFNVGSNAQNHRIREVGDIIHDLAPRAELRSTLTGGDVRDYRVDFSKIEAGLGFEPQWTVADGARQIIDALTSGAISNHRDPIYDNFKLFSQKCLDKLRPEQTPWDMSLENEYLACGDPGRTAH